MLKFSKICLISRVILIRGIAQFALGTLDCVWLGATVRRKSLNELIRRYPGFNFSDSDSAAWGANLKFYTTHWRSDWSQVWIPYCRLYAVKLSYAMLRSTFNAKWSYTIQMHQSQLTQYTSKKFTFSESRIQPFKECNLSYPVTHHRSPPNQEDGFNNTRVPWRAWSTHFCHKSSLKEESMGLDNGSGGVWSSCQWSLAWKSFRRYWKWQVLSCVEIQCQRKLARPHTR